MVHYLITTEIPIFPTVRIIRQKKMSIAQLFLSFWTQCIETQALTTCKNNKVACPEGFNE